MNSAFTANAFTYLFVAALLAATGTRLWLSGRQLRHVLANRAAVPPTFAEAIPLDAHQKAADYTAAKVKFSMVMAVVDVGVLVALTLGGLLQWLIEQWARVLPVESLWHGAALVVTTMGLQGLVGLPAGLYRTFVIEERFGFNRMTLRLFLTDLVKHAAVGITLGTPLLLAILWLMGEAGHLWWLYAWVVVAGYTVFVQMIYPALIMPLFNKFSPLTDPALADRLEKLLARCGFRSRGLFVMDGSKRSGHGNAFFSGFGSGKRIVLFDTLISRLLPSEVEAVLAHELGHYKLHHIVKGMVLSWSMTLALLFGLGLIVGQPWFYEGLGVQTQSLGVTLLLFLLVAPELLFFLQPLASLFSRKHEFEADRYATQHAAMGDLVSALVKLYKDNASTLTPDPVHSAFYDSHPPAATRIARLRAA